MDGYVDTWIDGWMDGYMDTWIDGWIDGWIDEQHTYGTNTVHLLSTQLTVKCVIVRLLEQMPSKQVVVEQMY